jgi:rhamnosyltransferase
MNPLASIVLVTKNGGDDVRALVASLARQRTDFPLEIIAVDSGSTDGTADWLEQSRWIKKVVRIAPEAFNHGTTRNLGIQHATGDLAVLIVQDALPVSPTWLMTLVEPLRSDPTVAGTYCRQRPRPNASAITRHYAERWAGASPHPRRVAFPVPGGAFGLGELSPSAMFEACTFDNVCSCVRRSVWERIPFPEAVIAEDIEWAKAVLVAGHALEYVPDAEVVHSHDRSPRYELARTSLLHHRLFDLFGLRTIPRKRDLARAMLSTLRLHVACELRARSAGTGRAGWSRALGLAVAWPLGQYLGGRAAWLGEPVQRWREVNGWSDV